MMLVYGKSLVGKKKIEIKPFTNATPVSIGSGSDQKVILDDPKCAERHASIRYWDDCFVLLNKDSAHGTLVNGKRVEIGRVQPGDVLQIGDTELILEPDKKHYRDDVTISG